MDHLRFPKDGAKRVKVACSVVDDSKKESVVHESKRVGGA